jgi:hypothetical protein
MRALNGHQDEGTESNFGGQGGIPVLERVIRKSCFPLNLDFLLPFDLSSIKAL